MKMKVNYFGIGLFVLSAFALLIAGAIFWGADTFNQSRFYIETYFDETVQGLTVGSPVFYRGVRIGEVDDISFAVMNYPEIAQSSKYSKYIQVTISMSSKRKAGDHYSPLGLMRRLESEGVRLRLVSQPLTGIAYVEADYVDPEIYPELEIDWEPRFDYLPSAPSLLSTLTQTAETAFKRLSDMDINALLKKADLLLTNLNQAVLDAQVKTVSDEIIKTVQDFGQLSRQTRSYLEPRNSLAPRVTLDEVLSSLQDMLKSLNDQIGQANVAQVSHELVDLLKQLQTTNEKLQAILMTSKDVPDATVEDVLVALKDTSGDIGQTVRQLDPDIQRLLEELTRTTRQLQSLISDLKEHPSRVIGSKPPAATELKP